MAKKTLRPYLPEDPASRRALGSALTQALRRWGYARQEMEGVRELVFSCDYSNGIRVKVYTSAEEDSIQRKEAREYGKDAIHVCAVACRGGVELPLVRVSRVNRSGFIEDIIARMQRRMKEVIGSVLGHGDCPVCTEPLFISRQGSRACSARCAGSLAKDYVAGLLPVEELIGFASKETLKRIYWLIAQDVHPDRGGDTASMQRVNLLWEKIQKSALNH